MQPRISYAAAAPGVVHAMRALEAQVQASGLEPSLLELVRVRASQMNGCAYCIDMHTKDALAMGETAQRLFALDAWQETPFYTDRERAALAWTEAVTRITDGHVPDALFDDVRRHFTDAELANLTLAVVAINGWNRIVISFRTVPGSYQPTGGAHAAHGAHAAAPTK